jgi:hypothetical protein
MNLLQGRSCTRRASTLAQRIWALSLLGALAASLASAETIGQDPFGIIEKALRLRKEKTYSQLLAFIEERVQLPGTEGADGFLLTAELMKQVGDYRAEDYFAHAISSASEEAAYELFYADYLRNFRGPGRPLFEEAENHYFAALRKLHRQRPPSSWSEAVRQRVLRGLVALYQEDGTPLAWRQDIAPRAPFLFFSSTFRAARSTSDLDEIHDVRDFTAEALFAESATRLHRALTDEELRGLIRRKEPAAYRERLRFRVEEATFDISYERRAIENAQVTSFLLPDNFNRVQVDDLGLGFTVTLDAAPDFDGLYFRQAVRGARRQGLIELRPRAAERVLQTETELAFSGFPGSNKTNFSLIYVGQDIKPQIANPPRRDRSIFAARLDYQILRPIRWLRDPLRDRFATRGWHLFGGFAVDQERFGTVLVKRDDVFVGTALNGLGPFDVTLQPTVFRQRVTDDRSQASSQLRLDGTVVVRLLDEESHLGIPKSFLGLHPAFVHLVIPVKHDRALEGLSAFENERAGAGVDAKFFALSFDDSASAGSARFGSTTLLLGCHWYRERFPRLGKRVSLMDLSVSLGF